MIWNTINFEELHDSVIGDEYDFKYICIKQFNKLNLEIVEKGKLIVDTITTNIISLNIKIKGKKMITIYIYKDETFTMSIAY